MIRIRKGVDLPIAGEPAQAVGTGSLVRTVALVADDYIDMKPTMDVGEGDRVKIGQRLFSDKKTAGVHYTSPGGGTVSAVNRGAKRAFQSIVIQLDDEGKEQAEEFPTFDDGQLDTLGRDTVQEHLLTTGLWTAFRARPYSKVPAPQSVPHSIFVSAIDTRPLAVEPTVVISEREADFVAGLRILRHLTDGKLFLCKSPDKTVPGTDLDFVTTADFDGPHPAGLPGTHIHFLDPVSERKTVWYLNYQDVIAIGATFRSGRLSIERVISLAGPAVKDPRLIRTRLGASTTELTEGELQPGANRVISGSVFAGRACCAPCEFLGRYDLQISALHEGSERVFLGWQRPGMNKFSVKPIFASALLGHGQRFPFTTSKEGGDRAMVPIGMYEKVMPMDILPTFLLRALIVGDTEQARALGCLELDEEDIALCTFVCPGKYEYGPMLRKALRTIEKEG